MRSTDVAEKTNRNPGGAPKGNMNAARHGVYSARLVSDEECELYDSRLDSLRKDFPNTDDSILQETALYYVRVWRALDSGSIDGSQKMDSKLRKSLKKIRYPVPKSGKEISPITKEEWMAGFMQRRNRKA